MRWEAELFDAAVIKVHASGKVDVVYDLDGSALLPGHQSRSLPFHFWVVEENNERTKDKEECHVS